MTPVSTRHLPWLLVALLLAIPPIYADVVRTHDECSDGSRAMRLDGVEGIERSERYRSSIFQWTSTEQTTLGVLNHAVLRARAPRALASPGGLVRPRIIIPSHTEVRREVHDGVALPIHFSHAGGAVRTDMIAHLFIYEGRPVEEILPAQLAAIWEQLAFGRRPVTVLMAWGIGTPEERERLEAEATRWIVSTWTLFQRQCGS